MPQANQMRAFISHNNRDNDYCFQIVDELKAYGVTAWIDERDLSPLQSGETESSTAELSETISRQIRQCNVFIPVFSPDSFQSAWVRRECHAVQSLATRDPAKILVPVTAQPFTQDQLHEYLLFWAEIPRIEAKASSPRPLPPTEAVQQLLRFLALLPPENNEPSIQQLQADVLLRRGRGYLAQGKYADAYPLLFQATHNDPSLFDGWYCKGEVLLGLDRPNEALASYDRAHLLSYTEEKLKGQRAVGWYGYGKALMALERYPEALKAFNSAIASDKAHIGALVGRADAQAALRHPRRAIRSYDLALSINQLAEHASLGKGRALLKLGREQEALLTIEHAVATDPENPDNWGIKADLLARRRRKRIKDADECYRVAIELSNGVQPLDIEQRASYWVRLGDLYFLQKTKASYDQALTAYQEATTLVEENAHVWTNIMLIATQDPDKREILSKAQKMVERLGRVE